MVLPKNLRHLFADSFAMAFLLALCAQPTLAGTVVGFELGQGFPPAGLRIDIFTPTTNDGLATWSTANLVRFLAGNGPDDGSSTSIAPLPVNGNQFAFANGVSGKIAQVIMELSTPKALDSFWYANRGGFAPRLEVEYFDTSGQSLGFNSYIAPYEMVGDTVPGSYPNTCAETEPGDLSAGCGVGLDGGYHPEFHQIFPTEPFQGVGLSKVIFNSYQNIGRVNGALNVGSNHGSFYLDDIALSDPTTTFNPNNFLRLSFETDEGFPDAGGVPNGVLLQHDGTTAGAGIPGVIDSFSIADNTQVNRLVIDHGPGCGGLPGINGFCIPDSEPDPIHGNQMVLLTPIGQAGGLDDDFTLEIDLNDAAVLAPVSFWYSYHGDAGGQTVDIEYFDLTDTSLGVESWIGSPDGGATLGTDPESHPQFDKLIIGEGTQTALPTVKGVALSRMIINSTHNIAGNDCSPAVEPCHASFAMDDLLFECTTGTCPGATPPCDFTGDNECNVADIDLLGTAVRNMTSDAQFNVDGLGDANVPDAADFDYYITDESMLGTGLGDHDFNFIVNFVDFVTLSNNFGMINTLWGEGNGNTDNITNFVDFVRISNNFDMNFASGADVPEPASYVMVAIGVLMLGRCWKNAKSRRI